MTRYLLILLLLISTKAWPQTTPNIGFDNGTFDHWTCSTGSVANKNGTRVITLQPSGPVISRQTLINDKEAKDAYGQFPMLCPNGSKYSIKLGNEASGAEAEQVSYTFTVPATGDYSIIFDYAVVLQNPTHDPAAQPRFTTQVYDVTDATYINCPSFDFIASSGLPGFTLSKVTNGGNNTEVYYKDWAKATIDLKGYPNKVMRIEFTTNDCANGAHFGYAYLDVEDNDTSTPITGNAYCINQNSVTMVGPTGFATYVWYNEDRSKVLGNTSSLTISPPPPDQSRYVLQVAPYPGLGCADDLYTTVNKIDADFNLVVKPVINLCPGTFADLTDPSVTAGTTAASRFSYYKDAAATDEIYNPSDIVDPGTYYIRGLSKEGCNAIQPVQVVIHTPPVITTTDPPPVTFPATINLSDYVVQQTGITYRYLDGLGNKKPLTDYRAVKYSGTYLVKATDELGCESLSPVKVVINAPPPIVVTAPNTFTPNGDGVNDNFAFSAEGVYTFLGLKIYTRSGQLVFDSKSINTAWDGTLNGKPMPVGVYYWVFEERNDYAEATERLGGSITLIR